MFEVHTGDFGALPAFLLTPHGGVAAVMFVALVVYVLTGGADFGGGMWDLFAAGPRKDAQRKAIENAIAPIWEVNHVWLILILVLLFTCFPRGFSQILTVLHVPITLLLLGIVLRGAAFALRQYSLGPVASRRRWGLVFSLSSLVAPFFLGVVAAALASGRMTMEAGIPTRGFVDPWATPFGAACGVMLAFLCAHLAAVYMCVETERDAPLCSDFRNRALASGLLLPVSAWGALLAARGDAPRFFERLTSPGGMALQIATGACGAVLFLALLRGRFRAARVMAVLLAALAASGLAAGLFPYLVYPDAPFAAVSAPAGTLLWTLALLGGGALVLAPSLRYLFVTFKSRPPA